jgi:hypothetical protein
MGCLSDRWNHFVVINWFVRKHTHTHTHTHVNHLSKQCPNEVNVKKRVDQNKSGSYLPKRWVFSSQSGIQKQAAGRPLKDFIKSSAPQDALPMSDSFFSWQGDSFPPSPNFVFPFFYFHHMWVSVCVSACVLKKERESVLCISKRERERERLF